MYSSSGIYLRPDISITTQPLSCYATKYVPSARCNHKDHEGLSCYSVRYIFSDRCFHNDSEAFSCYS